MDYDELYRNMPYISVLSLNITSDLIFLSEHLPHVEPESIEHDFRIWFHFIHGMNHV